MSGVALRCPACGTTQGRPGECDACTEAEVQYFCSNHTPGLWLEQPKCQACGARFGDAPRTSEPASRTSSSRPASPTRRPGAPLPVPRRGEPARTGRRRPVPPSRVESEDAPEPSLADLLADITADRGPTRVEDEAPVWREAAPAVSRAPFAVLGCLGRLALAAFILIVLAVMTLFLLAGGLMQ